jgi:hypothetical protein
MIPNLSKTAFLDVNFEQLDYENRSAFIMEKVFNYGLWEDQLAVVKYYGKERVKREIVKGVYFKKKVFRFLCVAFDLEPTDFTCYIRRQSTAQNFFE